MAERRVPPIASIARALAIGCGARAALVTCALALLACRSSGSTSSTTSAGVTGGARPAPLQASARERLPQGPYQLGFECGVDARHFGGHYTSESWQANLATGTSSHVSVDEGPEPIAPPPAHPVTPPDRARFKPLTPADQGRLEALARAVLARTDWPSDPGILDGIACSLSIEHDHERLFTAQRQQQDRGDAVDQLILALRALPP